MSHQTAPKEIDAVAEVLIKLQGGKTVSPDEAKRALEQHNSKAASDKTESGSSKVVEKLRQENKKLNQKVSYLETQIAELKNRLSKVAGDKLTDNNPDIADLSDPYRPTKIAEMFHQLYDEEWSHAYEELDKKLANESDITNILATVVKEMDTFCQEAEKQQLSKAKIILKEDLVLPKIEIKGHGTPVARNRSEMSKSQEEIFEKFLRELRKALGKLAVRPLTEIFDIYASGVFKRMNIKERKAGFNDYIAKGLELIWMMKIQSPPLELVWAKEGTPVDKDKFTFYTKTGEKVHHNVWPAVLLHKDGPVVSKGVVQGM